MILHRPPCGGVLHRPSCGGEAWLRAGGRPGRGRGMSVMYQLAGRLGLALLGIAVSAIRRRRAAGARHHRQPSARAVSSSCGVSINAVGFALPDARGNYSGLDVDTCRAVAAAVLGDATKVKFVPTTSQVRFTALQSGEVDMLARNTTWTMGARGAARPRLRLGEFLRRPGLHGEAVARRSSAKQLDGATVCVQPGTTTELNLADYFRANKMKMTPVVIEQPEEIRRPSSAAAATPIPTTPPRSPPSAPARARMASSSCCCPRSSRRSRWAAWSARATGAGSTWCAGATSPW